MEWWMWIIAAIAVVWTAIGFWAAFGIRAMSRGQMRWWQFPYVMLVFPPAIVWSVIWEGLFGKRMNKNGTF
jgi:hypothetical protein